MNQAPYDPRRLAERAREIVANTRELSALGWTPATSSNFSMRLDLRLVAVTVSGKDKGKLTEDDITVINGKQDQLVGRIQERYGIAKDDAERQVNTWIGRM